MQLAAVRGAVQLAVESQEGADAEQEPWLRRACRNAIPGVNAELLESSTGFLLQHLYLSGYSGSTWKIQSKQER